MSTRPTIRLRPKMDPRRIRHGFPWVYHNEVVLDRRSRALAPGTIATLEDSERKPLGVTAVNPESKIVGRMLDPDIEAEIDKAWLDRHVQAAYSLRDQIYDAPFYRLIHAEADGLPGTIVDRFGEVVVFQANAAWIDGLATEFAEVLAALPGVTTVVKNASGRARALEGLDDESLVLHGALDGVVPVVMNGATYMADLTGGQKTGLFYDQRPNQAFVAGLAHGTNVLDVCSHVGGFALAALVGGATKALAVDSAEPALELARLGAEASGVADKFETRKGDAFDVLSALKTEGAKFGTVICDPPAFAPAKQALEAGLRAYEKLARFATPLVTPGGTLTLCSCSHAAGIDAFRTASMRGIGRAGARAQILRIGYAGPDHPLHPALAESGYLKAITVRILP
ncbi:class I SAM-dependent rRNA methyltransferase [Rhodobacteraceae bacterium]|nr:class I SAM-dependent rRNA methyltransferase [Paracoccaceae bacterium]